MNKVSIYVIILFLLFTLAISCKGQMTSTTTKETGITMSIRDTLPPPFSTKSVTNFSKVIGWKGSQAPRAPDGFTVTKFAEGLEHPKWIYVADNGDIFVAESNTILKGIQKVSSSQFLVYS
jgi:glucose/arabinose dehydrogenase